jgi:hypothetical protein
MSASINAGIEAARAAPVRPETTVFERIRSTGVDGAYEVDVRVARGTAAPLREGALLVLNRREVRLEEFGLRAIKLPAQTEPARSPLVDLPMVLREVVMSLFQESYPREHTILTVAEAVHEQHIGKVVFEPLHVRVLLGGDEVELLARSAAWSSDAAAIRLAGLRLTAAASRRLEAEEATLEPDGRIVVPGPYQLSGDRRTRRLGRAAAFGLSIDGGRLVNLGPLPEGVVAIAAAPDVSADFTWTGMLTPLLLGLPAKAIAVSGGR